MDVLIVDDSVVFRSQIKASLESESEIKSIDTAPNGVVALKKLEGGSFSVVTLDLEMPELDGLGTLQEIQKRGIQTNVIVFSSQTRAGAEKTLEALSKGAYDFVEKPQGVSIGTASEAIGEILLPKVRSFYRKVQPVVAPSPTISSSHVKRDLDTFRPEIIVIGSSTGGPPVLEELFKDLGKPRIPIVVTQHMPPVFTASLAARIQSISGIPCREAIDGEVIEPQIYIAPGDYHLTLVKDGDQVRAKLDQTAKQNYVRPAVDPMFGTAAEIYGSRTMGFVLTGMGEDGRIGSEKIKNAGGGVMIQDEASCVVYGMPAAVEKSGAFDGMGNIDSIKSRLRRMIV